jgi:hypothetical protein
LAQKELATAEASSRAVLAVAKTSYLVEESMTADRLDQLEQIVAQQSAEAEALRVVFQSLAVTMLSGFPRVNEMFSTWQKAALDRLGNEAKLADSENTRRIYEVAQHSAQTMFDEIAPAFGVNPSGISGPTN